MELEKRILTDGDYNLIMTEWPRGATTKYHQATANARVVGAEIALFINFLIVIGFNNLYN